MKIIKNQKKAPNPQLQIHTKQPLDTCEWGELVFQLCLQKAHFSKLMTKWKEKKMKKLNTSMLFPLVSAALTQGMVCSYNRRWKQTAVLTHGGQNRGSSALFSSWRTHPSGFGFSGASCPARAEITSLTFLSKHSFLSRNLTVPSNDRLWATPETHSTATKPHGRVSKPSQVPRAGGRPELTVSSPQALPAWRAGLPHPFQMLLGKSV